jgi:putative nucleotidyltransferase with HDIG domain
MAEAADKFVAVIINDIKSNCLKLPSLPEVAMRVRRAVEDENSSAEQVAKVINADPSLSARLLRAANSAAYRGARPIESTQAAVTRLGSTVVRNLVSSLVTQQLFQSHSAFLMKRMRVLWSHSAEVAVISQAFARRFTKLPPDQAMLAGLLHDIGKLPMLTRAEDFPDVMKDEKMLDAALDKLHPVVGKFLLEAWKFPPEIVAAASEHEDLGRYTEKPDYVDIVLLANLHSYIGKPHPYAKVNWLDIPALSKLKLTPAESLLALEEAKAEMAEMRSLLGNV